MRRLEVLFLMCALFVAFGSASLAGAQTVELPTLVPCGQKPIVKGIVVRTVADERGRSKKQLFAEFAEDPACGPMTAVVVKAIKLLLPVGSPRSGRVGRYYYEVEGVVTPEQLGSRPNLSTSRTSMSSLLDSNFSGPTSGLVAINSKWFEYRLD